MMTLLESSSHGPASVLLTLRVAEAQLDEITGSTEHSRALFRCGQLARQAGLSDAAESYLCRAVEAFGRLEDVSRHVQALIELAHVHALMGNYRRALIHLQDAHHLLRPQRDRTPELYATFAFRLGSCLREIGFEQRAFVCFQKCSEIARHHRLHELRATALSELGEYLLDISQAERQRYREEAWALLQLLPLPSAEAVILCLYRWEWDLPDGLSKRQEAYRLAVSTGSVELIIRSSNTLSNAFRRLGDVDRACGFGEQAVRIAQSVGYSRLEALCSSELSVIYRPLGRFDRAKELLTRAISLRRQMIWRSRQNRTLAAVLGNLGSIYKQTEELDLALRHFRESYLLHQQRNAVQSMSIQAGNIGTVYHRLGQREQAEYWYEEARRLAQSVKPDQAAHFQAGNLASLYQQWARSSEGEQREAYLQKALLHAELALEDQSVRRRARTMIFNAGRKGSILLDLGRPQEALPWLYRAYRISRQYRRHKEPIRRLVAISKAYRQMDRPNLALKAASAAIKYAYDRELPWSRPLVEAYRARAKAWVRLSRPAEAVKDYYHAARRLLQSYELIQTDETGIGLTARLTVLFHEAITLCYKEKRICEAFDFMEMARQPVYRQRLALTALRAPTSVSTDLIEKEMALLAQLGQLTALLADEDADEEGEAVGVYHRFQVIKADLQDLWSNIRPFPGGDEYVALREADSVSYDVLRRMLGGRDAHDGRE